MPAPNRLASAKSPYLREAADQPVDWFPWGEEAFAKARAEEKPILLDIGAQWCHWCHVIDHESYADPSLAEIINREFVAVKVDRDERPDVDARYQRAVQAMTGQGGWPLTVVLTPEGTVFFGGTYFPPREAHGRPAFRTVLTQVSQFWRERREEALAHAGKIRQALVDRSRAVAPTAVESFADMAVDHAEQNFDVTNGGFGNAPKFPHTSAIALLLRVQAREPREILRLVTETTLQKMGDGGIFDQLEGGFHRYSVDAIWRVPHFEKLLYDNAELLRNFVHGHQVLDGGEAGYYASKCRHAMAFVDNVLSNRVRGGFYASQDADVSAHDDGDYFTWTLDEIRAVIPDEEHFKLVTRYFGVRERGDMHHDTARNVLHVEAGPNALATVMRVEPASVESTLDAAREALLEARHAREIPEVDQNLYANWNGMMASAYLEAGGALDDPEATAFALKTLDLFVTQAWDTERGFAHLLPAGPGAVEHYGFLDDQAQMSWALLDAYAATGDARWLDVARGTLDTVLAHYLGADGAFHDIAPDLHEGAVSSILEDLEVPVWDNPTPSACGMAIRALHRLGSALGDARYSDAARRALEAAVKRARPGIFTGTLALAADEFANAPPHVTVVGDAKDAGTRDLLAAARRAYAPGKVVLRVEAGALGDAVPEAARGTAASRGAGAAPAAFVCIGERCLPPIEDPLALADAITHGGRA